MKLSRIILALLLILALGPAAGTSAAGDLTPPYQGLGRFVSRGGLDVEGCYREMQKQDAEYARVNREEAMQREKRLFWENLSVGIRVFLCIVHELREVLDPGPSDAGNSP